MNSILFLAFFSVTLGSNPLPYECLDAHLRLGWTFPDAIANCQFKVTFHFISTTNPPPSPNSTSTVKPIPPRFLDLSPDFTESSTFQPLPYILGVSLTLSLSIALSKFLLLSYSPFSFVHKFSSNIYLPFSVLRPHLPQIPTTTRFPEPRFAYPNKP